VLQQRAAAALILAVLSLIAMMLIGNLQRAVYVVAVALVVAVAALALAISALKAAKRARTRRPRAAVASVVLGVTGALISGFALVGLLVFWSQYMQYANCLNGATTVAMQSACEQQFQNSVDDQITVLGGR
jgi:peptidoglycan/LPS O-acetylase OafA/YrhL